MKKKKTNCFRVEAQQEIRAVDGEDRRFILSFSSETLVERYYRSEVLDHSPDAVDLTRLNEIGCLLFNHDSRFVLGKIIKAWVENERGYAEVEFDTDAESERVFQKVKSGTLKGVSVGYRVNNWEEVMPNKLSADGRFTGPVDIARKWTPLEISIVSIPADASVGVSRQYNYEEDTYMDNENDVREEAQTAERGEQTPQETASERPNLQPGNVRQNNDSAEIDVLSAIREERARIDDITSLCREFDMDSSEFISKGSTVQEAQRQVLERMRETRKPVPVSVIQDEQDKFRFAASDGIMLRSGLNIENAAPGSNEFRSMSLRDLAVDCLSRDGIYNAHRMDNDTLLRQFFNPSSAFTSIMDMTIEKAYVQGYKTVNVSFDKWTSKGSLRDFKETKGNYYLAGPAGEFLLVPESGELKADIPKDELLPKRKLNTYGRQFSMTREAFINDDIGFLTTLPSRYAASAKRTINKQVYDILMNNPVIYDGTPLFGENHKNVLATGTALSNKALQKMIIAIQTQKDQFGQSIMIEPKFLIVPVGLGFTLRTILGSPTINTVDNTQAVNPLYNYPFTIIEEPILNDLMQEGKDVPWFIAANPTSVRTIQVDYLNGQEVPSIRRMERPGQLGYIWDIYLDWGVNVMDYKGLLKNPGVPYKEED